MAGGGVSTTVTVTYNENSTDFQYNNETLYIKIPAHTEYTLSFGDIYGVGTQWGTQILPPFIATSQSYYSRSLHLKYYPSGIHIMDVDGNLWEVSSWVSGSNATGVAVFTDTVRLIVAPDEWHSGTDGAWNGNKYSAWGGYEKTVSGIVTTKDQSVALADFAGSFNTDQIISQLSGTTDSYINYYTGAPAAEYCRAYSNGCKGVGEWYLPAGGELNVLVTNKDTINAALTKISGEILGSNDYTWSSTQHNSVPTRALMYFWSDGYYTSGDKGIGYGVRPVCQY